MTKSPEPTSGEPTPKELVAKAIAPLDRSATLEEKLDALATNLGRAEALSSMLRHASKENHATLENKRLPVRVALIAIMEFLTAAGIAERGGFPITLWHLLHSLNELDDSGNVATLFHSGKPGRGGRFDAGTIKSIKVSAAIAMEIAHQDCQRPLEQAQNIVARKFNNPKAIALLGRVDGGTVKGWRDKCIYYRKGKSGYGELFRQGLEAIRSVEASPERRLKRALHGLTRLLDRASKI